MLENEAATQALAVRLAGCVRAGDVIFLDGPLGAGKSVFARAFIRALSGDPDLNVPSPTFTLVQLYENDIAPLWHFDLYRMEQPEDVYEIGWEEARDGGIILVEWPERLGGTGGNGLAPPARLDVRFAAVQSSEKTPSDKDKRQVTFTPHGDWSERLKTF